MKKELGQLVISFAKVGLLTIGGGYAMLPMMEHEIVEKRGWATEEELLDYYAIGQCTPGVIAVNTATMVGYRRAGVAGGCLATLGVVTPSVLIITVIAYILQHIMEYPVVQHAFAGIRAAVVVLVAFALIKLGKSGIRRKADILIAVAALFLVLLLDISPVWLVLAAAVVGILLGLRGKAGGNG